MHYKEARASRGNEVLCELSLEGEDGPHTWQVQVDDNYACEPVLLAAAGRVARQPERGAAIFSGTEPFVREASYWIATPLGKARLPDPKSQETAWAVRLQQDYDPAPVTLYYDASDMPLAMAFDNVIWEERTTAGARRRELIRSLQQELKRQD
jgi:hypothetical protein